MPSVSLQYERFHINSAYISRKEPRGRFDHVEAGTLGGEPPETHQTEIDDARKNRKKQFSGRDHLWVSLQM